MFRLLCRCIASCVLLLSLSMQVMAGDSALAMLHTNGSAWLNGGEVPKSAALFTGDLVQTRADSTAHINISGSSVMILSDSLVKFEGPAVRIEHGAVRVATSRGLAAKAGEVTVSPAGNLWTEFQVTDVDGTVRIAANKGDLKIQDEQGTTTLSQGQQTTRDETNEPEKKKHRKRGTGAAAPAAGGMLSSTKAIVAGSAVVGGITAWVLLQDEKPLSPSSPTP